MGESLISSSIHFLTKQEKAFKVNMVRRSVENFANALVQQYQSIYLIALGANSAQVGLINSLANVGTTITALPSGWAIDRYGLKKSFIFSSLFRAMGALLFGLATNWLYTIPALFIFTLAASVARTSCPVVCGSSLINEDRAVGMQLCDSLAAVSGIVAPVVGATIISLSGGMTADGIRPIFFIQLGVLVLELVLIVWKFTNPSNRVTSRKGLGMVEGIREVLRRGIAVKRYILYSSIERVPFYLNSIYLPLYAAKVKGADAYTLGGMATAALLVPLILSIPSGKLADRFGRKKVVYLCVPLFLLSLVFLAIAPEGNSFMLIAAGVFQGFYMLGMVTGNAIRAEIVPISLLGSWGGLLGLFGGVVGMIVPITAGYIWSASSPLGVLILIFGATILGAAVLTTVPETLKMTREI